MSVVLAETVLTITSVCPSRNFGRPIGVWLISLAIALGVARVSGS